MLICILSIISKAGNNNRKRNSSRGTEDWTTCIDTSWGWSKRSSQAVTLSWNEAIAITAAKWAFILIDATLGNELADEYLFETLATIAGSSSNVSTGMRAVSRTVMPQRSFQLIQSKHCETTYRDLKEHGQNFEPELQRLRKSPPLNQPNLYIPCRCYRRGKAAFAEYCPESGKLIVGHGNQCKAHSTESCLLAKASSKDLRSWVVFIHDPISSYIWRNCSL